MAGKGINYLMSAGFAEEQARKALTICNGDKEQALDYLL